MQNGPASAACWYKMKTKTAKVEKSSSCAFMLLFVISCQVEKDSPRFVVLLSFL